MIDKIFHILRSPVTVLLLIVVMGITFPMSLIAANRSSANAQRVAAAAAEQTQRNKETAASNKAKSEQLRLAICGFSEPFLAAIEVTPPERANTELALSLKAGLIQARTEVQCTPDLKDLK